MNQSWLVFQIKNQNVYQITYNGCTGRDTIDAYITMLAQEYKVKEDEVLVKFNDELVITSRVVSSELKKDTKKNLDKIEMRN